MNRMIFAQRTHDWIAFFAHACICAILLFLAIGATLSLAPSIPELLAPLHAGSWKVSAAAIATGLLALSAIGSSIAVAHRTEPLPPALFVALLVVASISTHLLLAATVEPVWGGDYLRYWDNALGMAGSHALDIDSFYEQRALPVFYPLVSAFGDSPWALKAANALALVAIQVLVYDVLRTCRSHQSAQGFSILFLLAPVPAYEALIPSHNLWGLFFASAALWLVTRACYLERTTRRYWPKVGALAVGAALVIELLELQRGTAFFFTASIALSAVCAGFAHSARGGVAEGPRLSTPALFVVAAVCAALYIPVGTASKAIGLRVEQTSAFEATTYMKLAAHGGTMGNGRSDSWARFDERFKEKHQQGPAATRDFAKSIILSSWIDPDESKLRLVHALAPRLFDLGYPTDWNVALKSPRGISDATRKILVYYADAFGFLLALLFIGALLRACVPRWQPPAPVLIPLFLTAATALALLAVFENKAPNLFSIWLTAPLLVAWTYARGVPRSQPISPSSVMAQGLGRIAAGILLVVSCLLMVQAGISAFFTDGRGRILQEWSSDQRPARASDRAPAASRQEKLPLAFNAPYYEKGALKPWVIRDAADDSHRLSKYASNYFTILELAAPPVKGDAASMSRKVCVDDASRGNLEFFLFSVYQRKDRKDSFFVDVFSDDRRVKRISVPLQKGTIQLVEAPLFTAPGCKTITISLVSNVTKSADSWRRASHVEVWLPRLVE